MASCNWIQLLANFKIVMMASTDNGLDVDGVHMLVNLLSFQSDSFLLCYCWKVHV